MTNAVVQNTQKVAVQQKAGLLSQEAATGGFWDTPAISAEKIAPKPIPVPETAPATLETIFRDNTPHRETNLIKDNITYLSVTLLTVLSLFIVFRFLKLKGVIKIDSSKIKIPSIKRKWLIIILIIFTVIASASGAGYFGMKQYQKYQTEVIEKEKLAQEVQEQKDLVFEKLKQEVDVLRNKKQEVITQTIIKEVSVGNAENSLAYIAQYWRPVIAYIECDAYGVDQVGNVSKIGVVSGSGTGVYTAGQYVVWTNKHVTASSGGKSCRIHFPDSNYTIISVGGRLNSAWNTDFVIVDIPSPDEKLGSIIKNTNVFCTQKPSVGDQVVILGYPGIGSQTDITVTEGIISGYDGSYFITSAKVEHGNSGGAAILVKDNCYLGIPTFVQTGTLESLARILDWHKFDGQ